MQDKRRIVIIGATGFNHSDEQVEIKCFNWSSKEKNNIKKLQNIRDYDTIILNLLELNNEEYRNEIPWDHFQQILDYRASVDILGHGGSIFVIGDPRFDIQVHHLETTIIKVIPFLHWTGVTFYWDPSPGKTVKKGEEWHSYYSNYVDKLHEWQYSLCSCSPNTEELGKRWNLKRMEKADTKLELTTESICTNRYANALVFELYFDLRKWDGYSWVISENYGSIYFLPEISLNGDETIQLVLNDTLDIQLTAPEPEWLVKLKAPGQEEFDSEVSNLNTIIDAKNIELEQAESSRTECRKFLKLLYERELALEPIVRDVLCVLGAKVEDPIEKNKEDGWIKEINGKEYKGVLEIKSTRLDHFNEDGRKQLLDWVNRGITLRNIQYKGIFIGNSAIEKPVEDRPFAFSDSWEKAAELGKFCAMKTEHLYIIYKLNCEDKINIDAFWETVFNTNGIFDLKKYLESQGIKDE